MKVCRMCWVLLDDQLNICNCAQGANPSIFFKDISDMINHFVIHERLMSKRARRLEELVNEEIKKPLDEGNYEDSDKFCSEYACDRLYQKRLQSLIDNSNNTDKELGPGGKSDA